MGDEYETSDEYEMYEYEYGPNNGTKLEARSLVPVSPGESNDEIDALCEENPKECAKKHLNLMGFRNKLPINFIKQPHDVI